MFGYFAVQQEKTNHGYKALDSPFAKTETSPAGFEPARENPQDGTMLRIWRLNHSAKVTL